MRCLTLAGALREVGIDVVFICRELKGNMCDLLEGNGYVVHRLSKPNKALAMDFVVSSHADWLEVPIKYDSDETRSVMRLLGPVDWLIVDNYALDASWEREMRPYAGKIMVIDDLADRPHDCDLLLDQNLYDNWESRYDGLVPDQCSKLLGPRHVLLRPEFMKARSNMRYRDGSVRRILIFFGGSDPTNETTKALEAIISLKRPDIAVDVVVGAGNPHKHDIKILCASIPNTTYHCQIGNMAELMMNADLAIGAGGSSLWERCFVGLPSIALVIAENQAETTKVVAKRGALFDMGRSVNVSLDQIVNSVRHVLKNPIELRLMGEAALKITEDVTFTSGYPLLKAIIKGANV